MKELAALQLSRCGRRQMFEKRNDFEQAIAVLQQRDPTMWFAARGVALRSGQKGGCGMRPHPVIGRGKKVFSLLAVLLFCVASVIVVQVFAGGEVPPTRVVYLSAGTAEVEQEHDRKWVEAFNESQDEIYVDYELVSWADIFTRLYADIAAGNPPDVVWYGALQLNEWYKMGLLEPLDDWLGDAVGAYLPHLTAPGSDVVFDGKMYGAPFTQAARGVVVRRDWFEEAGVPPEEILTWDDLIEAAERVSDPARGRYATTIVLGEERMTADALHHTYGPSHGLRNAVDFRDEMRGNYIAMLRTIQRLGTYMPSAQIGWAHRDNTVAYTNETVAITLQSSGFQGSIRDLAPEMADPSVTAVIAPPAGGSQKHPAISAYTVGYAMMEGSENKEAAAEFIRFMTQPTVAKEWPMNLSPHRDVTIEDRVDALGEHVRWWEEQWSALLTSDQVDVKAVRPYSPAGEINRIINRGITDLLVDDIAPEAVYEEMKRQVLAAKEADG